MFETLCNLVRKSLAAKPATPRRTRLGLEALEAREVPTVAAAVGNVSFNLYSNGNLWEHTGTSSSSGWRYIDSNVAQVSTGLDASGNIAAFILYKNGNLWEDTNAGWNYLTSGVRSISASQVTRNDVFVVLNNNVLWEHLGTSSSSGWYYHDYNVAKVSAGVDASHASAAFILYTNGNVWEHVGLNSGSGWYYVTSGVRDLSASQATANDVFVVLNSNVLWEHVGTNSGSGWIYHDYNVSQVSAGVDSSGVSSVFILYNNGNLWEHVGSNSGSGWYYVDSGVHSISASQTNANTVFEITGSSNVLWEHIGTNSGSGWYYIDSNLG